MTKSHLVSETVDEEGKPFPGSFKVLNLALATVIGSEERAHDSGLANETQSWGSCWNLKAEAALSTGVVLLKDSWSHFCHNREEPA